jgi:hypothetical protein
VRGNEVNSVSSLLDWFSSSSASHVIKTGVYLKMMTSKRFVALGYKMVCSQTLSIFLYIIPHDTNPNH